MGFGAETPIYLAGGTIYEEEYFLAPLKKMFPALITKESLLSPEELEPFKVVLAICLAAQIEPINFPVLTRAAMDY